MRYLNRILPLTGLLDLLCPPICPVCEDVIENVTEPFCPACIQNIVTPSGRFCLRCGGRRFVSPKDSSTDGCVRCRTAAFSFKRVIALGEYESDLRTLILQMKTDRVGILAVSAARMLAISRRSELESVRADCVVPVPMHRLRRADRGVNSPDLLAEELARQLKIPFARRCVRRVRRTDLQYTLSHQMRAENVRKAFAIATSRRWVPERSAQFIGKNVLLVDDILTTGATCNAVSRVLLSAGVRTVTVAVLARAEGSDYRRTAG